MDDIVDIPNTYNQCILYLGTFATVATSSKIFSMWYLVCWGWPGGLMVLSKLSVLGRPTDFD